MQQGQLKATVPDFLASETFCSRLAPGPPGAMRLLVPTMWQIQTLGESLKHKSFKYYENDK